MISPQPTSDDDNAQMVVWILSGVVVLLFVSLVVALSQVFKHCCCYESEKTSDAECVDQDIESSVSGSKTTLDKFIPSQLSQVDEGRKHLPVPMETPELTWINSYRGSMDSLERSLLGKLSSYVDSAPTKSGHSCSRRSQLLQSDSRSSSLPDLAITSQGLVGIAQQELQADRVRAKIWFSVSTPPTPPDEIHVYVNRIEHLPSMSRERSSLTATEGVSMASKRRAMTLVCAYLLPDEANYHMRTSILNSTENILIFNELLKFKVVSADSSPPAVLPTHLRLSAYELDRRRLRHTVGHVIVPLDDEHLCSGAADRLTCEDLESDEILRNYQSIGEVLVSLTYDPDAGKIEITLVEIKGLSDVDPDEELYLLIEMLYERETIVSRRTDNQKCSTITSCENNFRCEFPLPEMLMERSSVRISVMTLNSPTGGLDGRRSAVEAAPHGSVTLGSVTLGCHSCAQGEELEHWLAATSHPSETFARWHRLTDLTFRN